MASRKQAQLSDKVSKFNEAANTHLEKQAKNPFSNAGIVGEHNSHVHDDEYGRPVKGSKSEKRGFQADQLICREVLELCQIMHDYGKPLSPGNSDDPRMVISFGELFDLYTVISNKLVGMLLRARKHHIVDFKGEMLFQRRDDDVPIILLKSLEEIKDIYLGRIQDTQEVIQSREHLKRK